EAASSQSENAPPRRGVFRLATGKVSDTAAATGPMVGGGAGPDDGVARDVRASREGRTMEYAKRRPLAVVLVAAAMAATAGPAAAEELQVRSGVVTSILAVEAPPPAPSAIDARQSRELGGLLGRAVGQATGSDVATAHLLGRLAADVVGSAGRDRNGAGSPG